MKTIRFHQQVVRPLCSLVLLCLIVANSGNVLASSAPHLLGVSATVTNLSPDPATQQGSFLDELAKDT